jgi:hypothetical protein
MVKKTKRTRKPSSRTRRVKRKTMKHEHEHEPTVEEHHFYSKIAVEGNRMFTESQKDDEPVKREIFTLRRLEKEIPVAADLIKIHLQRKVPPALNRPFPRDIGFKSVLPNPYDLGLMPPQTKRRHKHHHHSRHHRKDDKENVRLVIQDGDGDGGNYKQPRNLFDLP